MGINTERKSLNLNKCSVSQEQSVWIEQDIIVPDTKPDAVKIVHVSLTPYVSDVDVMDAKVKISGKVNYFIIYKVADEKFSTRGLFVTYPYTELLEVSGIEKGMEVSVTPMTKNVIYSLLNERKISVKTEVAFKVRGKSRININLINSFDKDSQVECKMCESNFYNIVKSTRNVITSKEDIMLPKESEDFFEILKVDASIKNTEFKESYNKIMVKGDINLRIMYLSENAEDNIKKFNTTIPFSSMVELENITDNSKYNINYVLQDFGIRQNSEITSTKTLTADYQIEVNVDMYEEERVEYVEDFYSQQDELKFENSNVDIVRRNRNVTKNIDIRENINGIIPSDSRIIDYDIDINNINTIVNGNEVRFEGNAKLYIITQNVNDMEMDNKSVDILINQAFNIEDLLDNEKIYLNLFSDNVTLSQNGNDIDFKFTLIAKAEIEDISNMNIIQNILQEKLDTSNLDSMNIYIVKNGDTLWSIAKKYKTSVDKIMKTNDIDNPDMISIGQKIFVIR